jgi:hypothetical protein
MAWWLCRSSKPRRRRLRRLRWVRFPHAPATLPPCVGLALALALMLLPPSRAAAQDAARRPSPVAPDSVDVPARADSLRRYPSPLGALWRSFLIPGWGQAALDRKLTGGIFVAWEGVTIGMTLKTRRELAYLRRTGSGRGNSKRQEHEDWLVLLAFNHLFSGLEAYVSSHLTDFPDDLRLRAVPGGAAATLSVPFRIR